MFCKVSARASRNFGFDSLQLFIIREEKDGSKKILNHEYEWIDHNPRCVPNGMHLEPNVGQKLMDDLWDAGIRPTEGAGSAGAMKRAEDHLADLRHVAFTLLNQREK